jgi:riboflavin kinase/FMN adenylyltransferase
LPNAVATTGTFDGVHAGHRKILQRLSEVAGRTHGETVLFTFHPHPRLVLQPDMDLRLITSLEEKVELLREAGLQHLIIYPFTKEFSRTSSLHFVRNILVNQIGVKRLVIGYDHHFGRNREGTFEHLLEFGPVYGFEVEEIPAQDVDDVKVSSTKIRAALLDGDVKLANRYLTAPYMLTGYVVKGNRIGHQIGFPTANIALDDEHKIIPADGVYAVRVRNLQDGNLYRGMCNIGHRPTIQGTGKTIEVHLFDFNADIYGDKIRLFFEERIRNEVRFDSVDLLIQQLKADEIHCRNLLG